MQGNGNASDTSSKKSNETESKKLSEATNEIEELKQQLESEKKKRQEVEKELKLQVRTVNLKAPCTSSGDSHVLSSCKNLR